MLQTLDLCYMHEFEISTLYVFGIYYMGEDKKRVNKL